MSSEIDPAIIQLIFQETIVGYSVDFALLTVLVYETVISFSKEARYFWSRPFSTVAAVYFMNRFSAVFNVILNMIVNSNHANQNTCSGRLVYVQNIISPITIICIDFILLLRIRALYSQGRIITAVLAVIFVIEALTLMADEIQTAIVLEPTYVNIADGLSRCGANGSEAAGVSLIAWIIPLAYDALLAVLAIYKTVVIWNESADRTVPDLVRVLVRDQVLYFVVILLIGVTQALTVEVDLSVGLSIFLSAVGSSALLSIVGSRLLVGLKELGEKGLDQGSGSLVTTTVSEIDFAEAPVGASMATTLAESSLGNMEEKPDEAGV